MSPLTFLYIFASYALSSEASSVSIYLYLTSFFNEAGCVCVSLLAYHCNISEVSLLPLSFIFSIFKTSCDPGPPHTSLMLCLGLSLCSVNSLLFFSLSLWSFLQSLYVKTDYNYLHLFSRILWSVCHSPQIRSLRGHWSWS